jgi:hypothetical protein
VLGYFGPPDQLFNRLMARHPSRNAARHHDLRAGPTIGMAHTARASTRLVVGAVALVAFVPFSPPISNIALINTPEQFRTCNYLPESYPWIDGHTPPSVWFRLDGTLDVERLKESLAPFADSSLVVKDYVRPQKHYWQEACFIPARPQF